MTRRLVPVVLLWLLPVGAWAQQPDSHGEIRLKVPEYRGEKANAPVPPSMHTANKNPRDPMWGGCCPSSVRTAALYHGVPREKVDHFWRLAQERVGRAGTNPQMLAEMLRLSMPEEGVFNYYGGDPDRVLDALSRRGRLICSWMNTGAQYNYRPIAHWVNVAHYKSGGLACVVDNNDPGYFRWMPAAEMARRAVSAPGQTWIFCFTRDAKAVVSTVVRLAVPVAIALVGLGLGVLVVGVSAVALRRPAPAPEPLP